jgi:hypothetical protein
LFLHFQRHQSSHYLQQVAQFFLPGTQDIIGAVNQPGGWRGGTGKLELLVRDAKGGLRLHPVAASEVKTGPVCWSRSPLEQPLKYYRLNKANTRVLTVTYRPWISSRVL